MALKQPIVIKKKNRGKFNALKKKTGKSTEEANAQGSKFFWDPIKQAGEDFWCVG